MLNLRASSPSRNRPFSAQIYVTKMRFAKFLALARLFLCQILNLTREPNRLNLTSNLPAPTATWRALIVYLASFG